MAGFLGILLIVVGLMVLFPANTGGRTKTQSNLPRPSQDLLGWLFGWGVKPPPKAKNTRRKR